MNISKSFNFIFEDRQWVSKLGVGLLVMFVPILSFAWVGYLIQLIRNVMDDVAEPLPDWSDMGKKFQDGLMLVIAGLIYGLPILLPFCAIMAFSILPVMMAGGGDMEEAIAGVMAIGSLFIFCLMCMFVLYGLVLSVIYPAIQVLYAKEGTLGACFKFGEVFGMIRDNSSAFITAWLVSIAVNFGGSLVIGLVAGLIGWIPCLGQLAAMALTFGSAAVMGAISAHLFGQFGAQAFGNPTQAPISAEY